MHNTYPTEDPSTTASSQDRAPARFLDVSGRLAVSVRESDVGDSVDLCERLDTELMRIQKFGDDEFENLNAIVGAENATDLSRKLHRFVLASLKPGPILGRAIEEQEPGDFEAFCLRLSAYREFLSLLDEGNNPRKAADQVIDRQRERIQYKMQPRFEAPCDEAWMLVDADVFGADDEIDLGAVRAEIDRLLGHLDVDPARIHVSLVPDDGFAESPSDGNRSAQ